LPIEFNIPAFENPDDIANYISLLKQIGYSKEDLEQIIRKMPNIARIRKCKKINKANYTSLVIG